MRKHIISLFPLYLYANAYNSIPPVFKNGLLLCAGPAADGRACAGCEPKIEAGLSSPSADG